MKGNERMEKNKKTAKQSAMENYAALVKRITPKSKLAQGCLRSFWVGGSICVLGNDRKLREEQEVLKEVKPLFGGEKEAKERGQNL